MAYNADTGLVYIPALDIPFSFAQDNAFKYKPGEWNTGVDLAQTVPTTDPDQMVENLNAVKGHLAAWDPVAQKEVWRVQHQTSWNGGVLTTAGNLVFQGRADGTFVAYAADSGETLWEFPAHIGIIAPPVSYAVDGEQYVAVVAGWGGAFALASGVPRHKGNMISEGRILTFKLGGTEVLPEPNVAYLELPQPPEVESTPEQVATGETLFHTYCAVCHGPGALSSGGGTPDLRYSSADVHESWNAIVLEGAFVSNGMSAFGHVLDEAGSDAIQAYVINQARGSIELCQSEYRKNYPEVVGTACVRAEPQG
jgi:mono/diheme cytochrome c family protein